MDTKQPLKILNGVNGQLEVFPSHIIIKRKGFLAKMTQGFTNGEKTIYINQISSIKVKQGGLMTNGFIQFIIGGNIEYKKGIVKETKDENAVIFRKNDNELVEEIKKIIEEHIQKIHSGGSTVSSADEILKYKNLLDQGIITQSEFEEKKKQLLAS